jgi:hypothetical protein
MLPGECPVSSVHFEQSYVGSRHVAEVEQSSKTSLILSALEVTEVVQIVAFVATGVHLKRAI